MMELAPTLVLLTSAFAGALISSFAGFAFAPVAGVILLTTVENVVAARRACTDGHFVQVMRIYEELDLGPSNASVWR